MSWADEGTGDAILSFELILIQQLNFHLTIHNTFRPLEGFFIDVKTRYPSLKSPEGLRNHAKDFLVQSLSCDVGLLYSPSQIALSALLAAASKEKVNIDRYVTESLLGDQSKQVLKDTITRIKKIRTLVRHLPPPVPTHDITKIEAKLKRCADKLNDPTSREYKDEQDMRDDENFERQSEKNHAEREKMKKTHMDLLSF